MAIFVLLYKDKHLWGTRLVQVTQQPLYCQTKTLYTHTSGCSTKEIPSFYTETTQIAQNLWYMAIFVFLHKDKHLWLQPR